MHRKLETKDLSGSAFRYQVWVRNNITDTRSKMWCSTMTTSDQIFNSMRSLLLILLLLDPHIWVEIWTHTARAHSTHTLYWQKKRKFFWDFGRVIIITLNYSQLFSIGTKSDFSLSIPLCVRVCEQMKWIGCLLCPMKLKYLFLIRKICFITRACVTMRADHVVWSNCDAVIQGVDPSQLLDQWNHYLLSLFWGVPLLCENKLKIH